MKVNSEAVPVGWLAGGRTDCGRAVVHGGRRRSAAARGVLRSSFSRSLDMQFLPYLN